jgi:hypothetical protein
MSHTSRVIWTCRTSDHVEALGMDALGRNAE